MKPGQSEEISSPTLYAKHGAATCMKTRPAKKYMVLSQYMGQ